MNLLILTLFSSFSLFANLNRDCNRQEIFCDGVEIKNCQGQILAESADCEEAAATAMDGLFCNGNRITNYQGKILAHDKNCPGVLRDSRFGFFCDGGVDLRNIDGKILTTSYKCKELIRNYESL